MSRFREAHAVVGMHYGDEGKGRVVKSIVKQAAASGSPIDLVIKHNGGSQAGHTVVSDEGARHIHSQLGSGTFFGVPTYLAPTFYFNPVYLQREIDEFIRNAPWRIKPVIYVDVDCQVTWAADVLVNQHKEKARGSKRHGSCGHGIFETFDRVRNGITTSVTSLILPENYYAIGRNSFDRVMNWHVKNNPDMDVDAFYEIARNGWGDTFAALAWLMDDGYVRLTSGVPTTAERVVFESGQGLGLDMDNSSEFPHLTPSKTGSHNAARLCSLHGADVFTAHYVTRPYVTRHGAGRLHREWTKREFMNLFPGFVDETNVPNPWQESLRFAPIILNEASNRIYLDLANAVDVLDRDTTKRTKIHVTCAKQGDVTYVHHAGDAKLNRSVGFGDFVEKLFDGASYNAYEGE